MPRSRVHIENRIVDDLNAINSLRVLMPSKRKRRQTVKFQWTLAGGRWQVAGRVSVIRLRGWQLALRFMAVPLVRCTSTR